MGVSILVATTFDDGETRRRNIGRLRRAPDELESDKLGLLLDEAKHLLRRLQEAILQDQINEGHCQLVCTRPNAARSAPPPQPDQGVLHETQA